MTREQLDAIRARVEAAPKAGDTYIDENGDEVRILEDGDMPALLAEVERLNAERDAAFQRGVAAMREAAAKECWTASDELADVPDMETEQGTLQHVAYRIRSLPDPEDK